MYSLVYNRTYPYRYSNIHIKHGIQFRILVSTHFSLIFFSNLLGSGVIKINISIFLQVIFKLDLKGNCKIIIAKDLNKCLLLENYRFEYFRHMCILSGCDYLDSIPGIGIKRALIFMRKVAQLKMNTLEVLVYLYLR